MHPPPDPWVVHLLAIGLYFCILAVGAVGTAFGHGLFDALLSLLGPEVALP